VHDWNAAFLKYQLEGKYFEFLEPFFHVFPSVEIKTHALLCFQLSPCFDASHLNVSRLNFYGLRIPLFISVLKPLECGETNWTVFSELWIW
jgi:hypothetical protein